MYSSEAKRFENETFITYSSGAGGRSAISMSAQAEILITEYVEGSSYNKAIEITNTGSDEVNLQEAGYVIGLATNGKSEPDKVLELYGILKKNESIVLVNSRSSDELKAKGIVSDVTNFNGDDALIIKKGADIVDSFGQLGTDPGTLWGEGNTATQNKTLRRTNLTPRDDASGPFDPSVYFAGHDEDTFDGLVCTNEAFCSGEEPTPTPPAPEDVIDATIMELQGDGWSSKADGIDFTKYEYESTSFYKVTGVVTAIQTKALGKDVPVGFFIQHEAGDEDPKTSDGIFVQSSVEGLVVGQVVDVVAKVEEDHGWTKLISPIVTQTGTTSSIAATVISSLETDENFDFTLERHEGMLVELDTDSDLRVTRSFSYDYDSRRNNMVLSHKTPNVKPTQLYAAESAKAVAEQGKNKSNRIVVESEEKASAGEVPYFADFNPEDGYIRIGDRVENLEGVISYSYGEYRLVATNQLTKADFVRDDAVAHERIDAPALEDVSGIKVASFNVLNFFTSFSEIGGPLNASCADQADADKYKGCNRGSRDAEEFPLQRAKIVNAMKAMDADIIGIMEMENNGFGDGSAIKNLVDALNAEFSDPADFYTYVEISNADGQKYVKEGADFEGQKYFGTDAIMVGMFYRPASVSLAGDAQVIVTPEQHGKASDDSDFNKYQRHSLLQGFNVPGQEEPLHVVVNHFKSKGSGCIEDVGATDDLQGNCTEFRVSAAEVVGQAVSQLKGDVLVIGDLNSYGMEDPVLALTTIPAERTNKVKTAAATTLDGKEHDAESRVLTEGAGLVNLSELDAFSYTYEGELGSLDHVLGNASVAGKRLGITDWHINSLESNMFEYGSGFTGDLTKSENPFSASDHDPVIVTLNYKGVAEGVKVKPARDGESATLPVAVSSDDAGKYIVVTLDVAPAAKLMSFGAEASEQAETTKVTHQVTQAEANSGSADIALPAELASGNYQAKLALYEGYPNAAYEQTPVDLGTATIIVEKAASSSTSTPEPTPTPEPKPTTAPAEGGSSGGSFGFGALLALAGLGWTRRRRT
ncbi:ExeM/NucH family extracellular endonuclease [Photobacterium sagamiensis]|uniref:ExeM/NucH family extracellular endonuclease n=1 Tax=Photobacterium sagamiensis TaxID=2910241 RepID=UPI003D13B07E